MSEKTKKTKAQLLSKITELEAQLAHAYFFAEIEIKKLSTDKLLGSGVVLRAHFIGGAEAVRPVMIKDGLSDDTIKALQKDLRRSYQSAIEFKPSQV